MPASDLCEPQVINALEKAGWCVLQRQYIMRIQPDEFVYVDLRLESNTTDQVIIVVKVKCFSTRRAELDDFYHAVGQYLTYRELLKLKGVDKPLYLAVPEEFYSRFFARRVVQSVVNTAKVKIIRIDLVREEVVAWSN